MRCCAADADPCAGLRGDAGRFSPPTLQFSLEVFDTATARSTAADDDG